MSQKKQLWKYFRNLGEDEKVIILGKTAELYRKRILGMTELTNPETADSHEVYSNKGVQTVTRRGIIVDGKEYWDAELTSRYLGKKVVIESNSFFLRVYEMNNSPIILFQRKSD